MAHEGVRVTRPADDQTPTREPEQPLTFREQIEAGVSAGLEDRFGGGSGTDLSFGALNRDAFRDVRQITKEQFDLPRVADLDSRVNAMAARFKIEFGRWPSSGELLSYGPYLNSIAVMQSGTAGALPPLFTFNDENGVQQWVLNNPIDGPQILDPFAISAISRGDPAVVPGIPFVADPAQLVADFQALRQPSGGGGGGGGAGRTPAVFDKGELIEGATERWRGMLLESPNDADIASLVSDYTTDANAFWMREGGRRDFDTFVVDRIRQQSRYNYLYAKKPGFQSETEYLGGFRQVAGGLGLNASATLREVEAGASTGVGLAGFGERLSGIREVRTANAGAFSQRIAASAGQMGLTRT